jgi:hypothetical protein
VVNAEKCLFGFPLPSSVLDIASFPHPVTVKQLQAFLGLFNFYCPFVLSAARLVLPFICALCGSPNGVQPLDLISKMSASFQTARWALSAVVVLNHRRLWGLCLSCDGCFGHRHHSGNTTARSRARLACFGFFSQPSWTRLRSIIVPLTAFCSSGGHPPFLPNAGGPPFCSLY